MSWPASQDETGGFAVSVVIPLYNKANFIRRTLTSVLAQTQPAFEIVIVNDCSTDGSVDAIRDLLGPPVRLVEQVNAGPGPARNRGVADTTQPWIAFIDADDVWRPNHLATLAEVSRQFPDANAVATGFQRVGAQPDLAQASDDTPASAAIIDFFAPGQLPLWTSCVAVQRSAFTQIGGFGAFWPGEDLEMWVRLALEHVIAATAKPTAYYVQGTGGLMEQWDRQARGFVLQPVFATLDRALADPCHARRRDAIARYRRDLLTLNVKQALYRADAAAAREYAAELKRSGGARLGLLGPLTRLPSWLLRLGISARAALRPLSRPRA